MPQAVVLAGGLATRLGAHCHDRPKLLLPVAGRPFALWLIDRLVSCGFDRLLLLIGHLGDAVVEALGEQQRSLRIDYVRDGPTLRGTAGALHHARDQLAERFVLTYGDSYLPSDYAAPLRQLEASGHAAVMSVYENRGRFDRSNLCVEGGLVSHYGPGAACDFIDYGAIALRREAVDRCAEGDLGQLWRALIAERALGAHVVSERFYEIGSESGWRELDAHLGGGA